MRRPWGHALLTVLFDVAQELAWGCKLSPLRCSRRRGEASPERHVALLLAAGLATSFAQWALTRLTSGNSSIDVTAAIWFQKPAECQRGERFGTAVLSIVIVAMGVPLGREGASPSSSGWCSATCSLACKKLSDEQRRLIGRDPAPGGRHGLAVYSVPLGGALFALEVLRGALALGLVVPALTAALIATTTASFIVPNAPLYSVPPLPDLARCVPLGSHRLAVRHPVCLVGRVGPRDRLGLLHSPLGLVAGSSRRRSRSRRHRPHLDCLPRAARQRAGCRSAPVPASVRAGRPVAALVLVRPMATVASVASGAPGGLFTPSLAAEAPSRALHWVLGQLWLWVHPGGDIGLYAASGRGRDAGGHHPGTHLVAGADDGIDRSGARLRPCL